MPVQSTSSPDDGHEPATVVCNLDETPSSTVRDLVRGMLTGYGGLVKDAVLVTDELVSNAHRDGQAPPPLPTRPARQRRLSPDPGR
jgi:hypothetical protein